MRLFGTALLLVLLTSLRLTAGNILFGQGMHVMQHHDFLSSAEVDHVLGLARRMQRFREDAHPDGVRTYEGWDWREGSMASSSSSSSSTSAYEAFQERRRSYDPEQLLEVGKRWTGVPGGGGGGDGGGEMDPVLRLIEERIGEYAMIPPHEGEGPLMVGYRQPLTPKVGSGNARVPFQLRNVHHDLNNAPRRAVTALIYLTDVEEGGHTVFPCLGKNPDREACKALVKGFKRGERYLHSEDHPKCWDVPAYRHAQALCEGGQGGTGGEVTEVVAEGVSKDDSNGDRQGNEDSSAGAGAINGGLRIKPRRGMAVFFTSSLRDGSPDMLSWHAGCPVEKGEKYTLQKFKEFPKGVIPSKNHGAVPIPKRKGETGVGVGIGDTARQGWASLDNLHSEL